MGTSLAAAQCPALPSFATRPAGDFVTPAQEAAIGALMREQMGGWMPEFQDAALLAHPTAVLRRLEALLPATGYTFHAHLLDVPYADAFTMPGGDIYMTRPLVNLLASDDELAGILAHEMGHVLTHQLGLRVSENFAAMGVHALPANADLADFYNRLLTWQESQAGRWSGRQKGAAEQEAERGQDEADRVGILLLIHAGFPAAAFVSGFNRLADLQGQTGNWLENFLGTTTPDQRRLRAAEAEAKRLALGCTAPAPAASGAFSAWKAAVVAAARTTVAALPGLLGQLTLTPPLEENFRRLRFSPDGRRILVQVGGDVFVVGRDPLRVELRIGEADALDPQFTPDASGVVFQTAGLRVERWDIASRARVRLTQMPAVNAPCLATYLTPAGDRLACSRANGAFVLYNALTGAIMLRRGGGLERATFRLGPLTLHVALAAMIGSPQGKSLLVVTGRQRGFAVDLASGTEIKIGAGLNERLGYNLTFLNETEIAAPNAGQGEWQALEFPSGRPLRTYKLGARWVRAAAHGGDWIVGPAAGKAAAVFHPQADKFGLASAVPALDDYDGIVAAQDKGDLALATHGPSGVQLLGRLPLAAAARARFAAAMVSPDLRRIALSSRDRGGIWDFATGRRELLLRRFDGAWIEGDRAWMEFPAYQKTPRLLITLDLAAKRARAGQPQAGADDIQQWGPYLSDWAPAKGRWGKGRSLTVSDVRTGRQVWRQQFAAWQFPFFATDLSGHYGLFAWTPNRSPVAKQMRATFHLAAAKPLENDNATRLAIVDLPTGRLSATLILDPAPELQFSGCGIVGQRAFLEDGADRLLVYDLATGRQVGVFDGVLAATSEAGHWILVLTGRHRLQLVSADTLGVAQRYAFPSEPRVMRFSGDATKLVVMTSEQTVYTFAVPQRAAPVRPAA